MEWKTVNHQLIKGKCQVTVSHQYSGTDKYSIHSSYLCMLQNGSYHILLWQAHHFHSDSLFHHHKASAEEHRHRNLSS